MAFIKKTLQAAPLFLCLFTLMVAFNNCSGGFDSLPSTTPTSSSVSPAPTPSPTPAPSPAPTPTPSPSPVGNADDGSSAAPSGTALRANALAGYPVRPAWKVAGIDYAVGIPSGTVLKDPSTISMSGVSVSKSSAYINISGNNVTLDGYDFSLNGGWQVEVKGTNATIKNSKFAVGAKDQMPITAYYGGYVNLMYNTFEGGGANSSANAMFFAGAGALVEYNLFQHVPNDAIDVTVDGNFVIQYNLFDSLNYGEYHTDCIQTYFSQVSSLVVQYNTVYQPKADASGSPGSGNSFIRIGDQQGHTVYNPMVAYNTILFTGLQSQGFSSVFNITAGDGNSASKTLNPVVHDNYVDGSGVMYSINSPDMHDSSQNVVNPVTYQNVNLKTGNLWLWGPYNSQTAGVPSNPPQAPVISSLTVNASKQLVASGTAPANTTVTLFSATGELGYAAVKSGGSWSLTTNALASGQYSVVARTTDANANSSAASSVQAVIIP